MACAVFFPPLYDPAAHKYPLWVHLHGIYFANMGHISQRMGYVVKATEAMPVWDTLATSDVRMKALIVYPQALSPGGDDFKQTVSR